LTQNPRIENGLRTGPLGSRGGSNVGCIEATIALPASSRWSAVFQSRRPARRSDLSLVHDWAHCPGGETCGVKVGQFHDRLRHRRLQRLSLSSAAKPSMHRHLASWALCKNSRPGRRPGPTSKRQMEKSSSHVHSGQPAKTYQGTDVRHVVTRAAAATWPKRTAADAIISARRHG